MPVLGVHDARPHAQMPDSGQGCAAEKNEPLAVVEIVALVRAVVLTAVEIFAAFNEIDGQAVIVGHIDVGGSVGPRIPYVAILVDQMHGKLPSGQTSVEGSDYGDSHSHARQGQGQDAHDVGQASGFGERVNFRCQEYYIVGRCDHALLLMVLAKSATILR